MTYLEDIKQNFRTIYNIPATVLSEVLTQELCISIAQTSRKVIGHNQSVIAIIPKQFHTIEFYRIVLERNGDALRDISFNQRTQGLCHIAVTHFGEALAYVPKEYITRELCTIAVGEFGMALSSVPTQWIDESLCRLAVSTAPMAIQFVPEHCMTEDLWVYILGRHYNSMVLHYLPLHIREKIFMI